VSIRINRGSGSNSSSAINDMSNSNYIDIGNLRIQWGINTASGDSRLQVLPMPFGNTNYSVSITCDARTGAAPGDNGVRLSCAENKTLTSFRLDNNGTNIGFSWIAIGVIS